MKNSLIRCSRISLASANTNKLEILKEVQIEYNKVMNTFIQILWFSNNKVSKLLGKEYTDQVDSWLSARMIQSAGKQASGIVRGTRRKQEKRIYIYNKLIEEKNYKKARKIKTIIDTTNMSIPVLEELVPMELDSRFIKILLDKPNSFDGWIEVSSIGNHIKLQLPFRKHTHFNKMIKKGKIKSGLRLDYKEAFVHFDIVHPEKKTIGKIVGIDIGLKDVYISSDGQKVSTLDGYTLETIQKKLARKKKGSKGFKRAQDHRTNFINWSINQFNLSGVQIVKREEIKDLRKGKRNSRLMASWVYPQIFSKLERYCEEQGVLVIKVSPRYTSQRCSECGWTQKRNRKGKEFKCIKCSMSIDADLNASKNISLYLEPLTRRGCLLDNRSGFYWPVSQEHIVPDVQRVNIL